MTDGRTDGRTDAGNDNTRKPKLTSGKKSAKDFQCVGTFYSVSSRFQDGYLIKGFLLDNTHLLLLIPKLKCHFLEY